MSRTLIEVLKARLSLQYSIHKFLRDRSYMPIDAPILVQSPGTEVHLQYFATSWQDYHQSQHAMYLRSSPELHLKQALAMGWDRVYHLGKCFRNGGELSNWHHPEFTMLEFYQSGISLFDFMNLTEELIRTAAADLERSASNIVHLPAKIDKISIYEAFQSFAKIELRDGDPDLSAKGLSLGYRSLQKNDDFETAYFKILLDVIEPAIKKLGAVFLYDYPPSQCALARIDNNRAQRFELYLEGTELCNAFDELLDPSANRARIRQSNQERDRLGYEQIPEDEDFFEGLSQGISACCGNALGFDRLLALLLKEPTLDRCIPFRFNRPFRELVPPTF